MPVYSSQDIAKWRQAKEDLPRQIQIQRQALQNLQGQVEGYKSNLNGLISTKLMFVQEEISVLEAKINVLTLPAEIAAARAKYTEANEKAEVLRVKFKSIMDNLQPIDNEIRKCEATLNYYKNRDRIHEIDAILPTKKNDLKRLQTTSYSQQKQIRTLQAEIAELHSQISAKKARQAHDASAHIVGAYHGGYQSSISSGAVDQLPNVGILQSDLTKANAALNRIRNEAKATQTAIDNLSCEILNLEKEKSSAILYIDAESKTISGWLALNNKADIQNRLNAKYAERVEPSNIMHELKPKLIEANTIETNRQEILTHKEKIYKNSVNRVGEAVSISLRELEKLLIDRNKKRDELINEKRILETAINNDEALVASKDEEISGLERQLAEITNNHYLTALNANPQILYDQLYQDIQLTLDKYESDHPANQSIDVRGTLVDIAQHMKEINDVPVMNLSDDYIEGDTYRLKYYQLSGLIWKMYRRMIGMDNILADRLFKLLNPNAVEEVKSSELYARFCRSFPLAIRYISPPALISNEINKFSKVSRNLAEELAKLPANASSNISLLYQRGRNLLNLITKEKAKKADIFDWKYHTNLLSTTSAILANPSDNSLHVRFKHLAKHNEQGKPSLGMKVSGAALMFLGAAGLLAGVVIQAVSFGTASPIGIGCMAGGAALISGGFTLFHRGKQNGEDKALQQFAQAADGVITDDYVEDENLAPSTPTL